MLSPNRYRQLLMLAIAIACINQNCCFAQTTVQEVEIDALTGESAARSRPTSAGEATAHSIHQKQTSYDEEDEYDDEDDFEDDDGYPPGDEVFADDDEFDDDNFQEYIDDDDEVQVDATMTVTELHDNNDQNEPKCGIWVAPSTIKGAGLGMFAGQDFQQGQTLENDIAIPIIDLRYHHPHPFKFLHDEYTWSASFMNMFNLGHHQVEVACPGFGAAANSFLPVANVREWNPLLNDLGLHSSKDPGAGAFTPYYNRKATAMRDISAGEEFFVDYGEEWFKFRPFLGPIPLADDLNLANDLFQSYSAMKQSLTKQGNVPPSVLQELWDLLVRNTSYINSRVIGGFHHDNPEELELLEKQNITLTELRIKQGIRSPTWLAKHGTCADHLEAKPSTIPQAGRGAFTRRFLPNGTIIAQLPLIHILDKSVLEMYHMDELNRPDRRLGLANKQLLTNYCYGHSESTLVLCPYGPIVNYINHNQTLANVKLQWSDPEKGNHHPGLLNESLESLGKDSTAKLAFELVALRDLAPNEELFLDYGNDWEQAWNAHVAHWKPLRNANRYKSAQALNQEARVPTEYELLSKRSSKYDNVDLYCYGVFASQPNVWKRHWKAGTLEEWVYDMFSSNSAELYRCDNMRVRKDRATGKHLFTTIMWNDETDDLVGKLDNVPREALLFLDKPYTSDLHQTNVFRHSIGIPDEIFPKAWRNVITA
ncbi:hypothetical protein MPSEU_000508200 [Mayamaea pseudoterrestris]|nr:hypothetical protein MPSEU_000508200 [Mayamaea pseudoterrestris]